MLRNQNRPGKSRGSFDMTASMAGGPPVEAPIRMSPGMSAAASVGLGSRARLGAGWIGTDRAAGFACPMRWRTRSRSRRLLPQLCTGGRPDLFDQHRSQASISSETGPSGLATKSMAPRSRACRVTSRAVVGERGHHDHRARRLDHDAVEAIEAVHLRHVDVERHDVGLERLGELERLLAVAGEADVEIAFGGEDFRREACASAQNCPRSRA